MKFVVILTTNFRKIGVEKHWVYGAAWVLCARDGPGGSGPICHLLFDRFPFISR